MPASTIALLEDLLERTSRTFALTIPLLDEPLRAQVRIAYLLFRIADTLEDADLLGRDDRVELLAAFRDALREGKVAPFAGAVREKPPTANRDYADLLARTKEVFAALEAFPPAAARAIRWHLDRTAERMAGFVSRADAKGSLALCDLRDLRDYCYAVAGIVGEMLTELVLLAEPKLTLAKERLEADAKEFGEALQLVNILKDAGADLREGRTYVPKSVDRADVFALAAEDLDRARRYLRTLHEHGATRGTLAFHALPVRLAVHTLEQVKLHGPGAKMSREAVAREVVAMHASLDAGGPGL